MKTFLCIFTFCILFVSGCNRSNAPAKDASGATPTGKTLTVKITADAPTCFMSIQRGDTLPVIHENVPLPYEQTFNVKSGEGFNFTAGGGTPQTSAKANLRIAILYNGEEVASGVESDQSAALGTMFPDNGKLYMASCAFTIP